MDPAFVSLEQVLRAHQQSLQRYGGCTGVRDEGLLRSAVEQPLNDYFYGHADLYGIAAAYAFHIAQAQRSWMATSERPSRLLWHSLSKMGLRLTQRPIAFTMR